MERMRRSLKRTLVAGAILAGGAAVIVAAAPTSSAQADVTRGDFHAFAAGAGLPIGGHAEMVRRADGTTFVSIHVSGLTAGGQYASHVHKQRCETGAADGHFQQDGPAAGATPPNEIWLAGGPFNANSGGNANENATVGYRAHADAVSVVVHDLSLPTTANKVACANLD
jgi:hypothetical protein